MGVVETTEGATLCLSDDSAGDSANSDGIAPRGLFSWALW